MQILPVVAFVGFATTGLLYALGKAPMLLPLMFWLMMAAWITLRFREERKKRERLLDRIAREDR